METDSKTILIVEDEEVLRDAIAKKLTDAGYNTVLAITGDEALDKVAEKVPDLILLDILLPGLSGFEVVERLQHDLGIDKVPPIIVISNSGQNMEVNKILTLGIKDYIVKTDTTPDEILNKVSVYLDATNKSSPFKQEGFKILAIEDDNFLRDLLARKLGSINAEFIAAIDGENALEILKTEKPSVILLDLILPGIDGFEVLEKIKSDPHTEDIPVIILSNLGQDSDVERAKSLGAVDFLIKANFSIDEVIGKIKAIFAKKDN